MNKAKNHKQKFVVFFVLINFSFALKDKVACYLIILILDANCIAS